jgi:hypothetical protein
VLGQSTHSRERTSLYPPSLLLSGRVSCSSEISAVIRQSTQAHFVIYVIYNSSFGVVFSSSFGVVFVFSSVVFVVVAFLGGTTIF